MLSRPFPDFGPMLENLTAAGFDEPALRQLLHLDDLCDILQAVEPAYPYFCRLQPGPLSEAALLWLLHQVVPGPFLTELAGNREAIVWMLENKFFRVLGPGRIDANVDLSPCERFFFFHDRRYSTGPVPDRVYELGADSYALARLTPRKKGASGLDLCTGSGLHAVMAAADHERVVGVDLNPKALEFSRLNAHVNGLAERCEFVSGDLYEPVRGQTFDLITINPPFVSTPDESMEIHRTGGETGEEISRRAVAELPNYLRPGGTFAMVLTYPVMASSTYLERLSAWLGANRSPLEGGGVQGWGIAVLNFRFETIQHYIHSHGGAEALTFRRYLESYERLGIQKIGCAVVLIRRLRAAHPGFCVEHRLAFPRQDRCAAVEAYLVAQETYANPDWEPDPGWCPERNHETGLLWRSRKGDEGRLEPRPGALANPLSLGKRELRMLDRLDGRTTAAQLAARGVSAGEVRAFLANLGRNLYLAPQGSLKP